MIGTIAEFAVRAYDEDQACQKTEYWCKENPHMEIDPDGFLDNGFWAKPLDPVDELNHNALGDVFTSVKMLRDFRGHAIPSRESLVPAQQIGQPTLFDMDKWGRIKERQTE